MEDSRFEDTADAELLAYQRRQRERWAVLGRLEIFLGWQGAHYGRLFKQELRNECHEAVRLLHALGARAAAQYLARSGWPLKVAALVLVGSPEINRRVTDAPQVLGGEHMAGVDTSGASVTFTVGSPAVMGCPGTIEIVKGEK